MVGRHPGVFPQTVVQVIQKDAIKRLNLTSLLTEKEMLESVVPDVHLVATLMSLSRVIPEKNKAIAREVVRKVVDELMKKLSSPMQQAVTGALNRSSRRRNPATTRLTGRRRSRKPTELSAGVQDDYPGGSYRFRPETPGVEGHRAVSRPEWFDGGVRGLFRNIRLRAGLDPVRTDPYGGV